jgi:hypothetical protein
MTAARLGKGMRGWQRLAREPWHDGEASLSTLIGEPHENREKTGIEEKGRSRQSLPWVELRRGGARDVDGFRAQTQWRHRTRRNRGTSAARSRSPAWHGRDGARARAGERGWARHSLQMRWPSRGGSARGGIVAEPPELFQLKCPSHALGAVTHLNRNNPSVPQI